MKRVAAAVTLALMVTACGSTVQLKSTGTTATGDGLSPGTNQTGSGGVGQVPTTDGSGGVITPGGSSQGTGSGSTGSGGTTGAVQGAGSGTTGAGTTGSGSGSSGTSAAPSGGSIEIGFMTTNVGNAQSLGINTGQTYTDKQLYDALVQEYNAKGGLAGRKITPVYGDTDTASSDWSTQFQAACSNLTQDHKVRAVLGYVFVFLDSFEQCLSNAKVPHLYGGYQPGDLGAQRTFPALVSVTHPSIEEANLAMYSGAIASGRLTPKTKLGIIVDNCAHGFRGFDTSTAAYLKAQHITYEQVRGECANGAGDVGAAAATIKSAGLQFASHGVTVVASASAAVMLLFMENAESQGYHPEYLGTVGGAGLQANVPASQLQHLHGFGWMPAVDTDPQHQPYTRTPAQADCIKMLARHGLVPKAYNDFMFAYVTCDSLNLYAAALRQTGGRTDPGSVTQAVQSIENGFTGSATYGGGFRAGGGQRGGPKSFREYGWTASCSCFTYRGPVREIPRL